MIQDAGTDFDPKVVAALVAEALEDYSILPITFLETDLYQRLFQLLQKYIPVPEVNLVLHELRQSFYNGFTSISPQTFYSLLNACKKCASTTLTIDPQLPAWNRANPDLLILAENPLSIHSHIDKMTSHLKKSGFSSATCCLTYVTRCPSQAINSQIVKNCLPYLYTEIAILNPKLILTLGSAAYSAITGDPNPSLIDIKSIPKWFGSLLVIPEVSYGWAYHKKEKYDTIDENYISTYTQAYKILYGSHDI